MSGPQRPARDPLGAFCCATRPLASITIGPTASDTSRLKLLRRRRLPETLLRLTEGISEIVRQFRRTSSHPLAHSLKRRPRRRQLSLQLRHHPRDRPLRSRLYLRISQQPDVLPDLRLGLPDLPLQPRPI